jgi:hypothetical protein
LPIWFEKKRELSQMMMSQAWIPSIIRPTEPRYRHACLLHGLRHVGAVLWWYGNGRVLTGTALTGTVVGLGLMICSALLLCLACGGIGRCHPVTHSLATATRIIAAPASLLSLSRWGRSQTDAPHLAPWPTHYSSGREITPKLQEKSQENSRKQIEINSFLAWVEICSRKMI